MTYSDLDKRRANARAYLKRNPEYAEKARERSRIAQAAKRANDPGFRHRAQFYRELVEIQGEEKCAICGRVIRVTPKQVEDGRCLAWIKEALGIETRTAA